MISLRAVTYTYPGAARPVVEDLALDLDAGEFWLVAGPSGSGKSTVLRLFNGLVPHFHGGALVGTIRVGDRDPVALGPRGLADLVGFVGQDPEAHFVAERVEDELAFAMENHGIAPPIMARRIEEVLDQLSIASLRHRRIADLSGGEKQRVAIASVLTLQPEILVLDEPTSQLDPRSADEVLTALVRLNHDFGLTVVVSEHRLERLVPYVDRVLLLSADESTPRIGTASDILRGSPLAPPLPHLADALGWSDPPLTLKAARRHPELDALKRRLARTADSPSPAVPDAAPPALTAEGLWFRYPDAPRETLADLDLRLGRGTITALLGRNGAGKSTLLSTLVGLRRGDRGRVRLHSRDDEPIDPWRVPLDQVSRRLALLPQDPGRLLFHDTVREELAFGHSDATSIDWAHWCRDLEIDAFFDADPRDLSTGERQRVALAAVLSRDPDVLLLDEPTRGLDAPAKRRLAAWLRQLADGGLAVLLATHDVELVAACADRAAVLGEGRLVAEGPVADVLTDSPVFAPQIARLLRDRRWLDVDAVLVALRDLDGEVDR
ncbi:MAG: ATP-binding cassette domain-containing protein [Acidobacteriota bacterium]